MERVNVFELKLIEINRTIKKLKNLKSTLEKDIEQTENIDEDIHELLYNLNNEEQNLSCSFSDEELLNQLNRSIIKDVMMV